MSGSPFGLFALIQRLLGGPPQRVPPAFPAAPPPVPPAIPVVALGEVRPPPAPVPPPAPASPAWKGGVPLAATELSELFEARKLRPYRDSAGVWTIGIGSIRDLDGRPVTAATPPLTDAQAEALHKRDLTKAAGLVKAAITAPLTERQAAVLILLVNNVGDLRAAAPTIVKLVNAGRWRDAADFLKEFRNIRDAAGKLVPVLGLRRRRWAEAAYSLGMNGLEAHRRAWSEIGTVDGWPTLPV